MKHDITPFLYFIPVCCGIVVICCCICIRTPLYIIQARNNIHPVTESLPHKHIALVTNPNSDRFYIAIEIDTR